MRIGELGDATGVDIETIRYYERVGLLPPPARADNGYRIYGDTHVERLAFIRHCRSLDMSLAEIRRLLELVDEPSAQCGDADRLVDQQIERVRSRLASLRALERQLLTLRSKCRAEVDRANCGILKELVTSAQDAAATPVRAPKPGLRHRG